MQFAVNYSPEAAGLLAAGQIEIDLYKCPDWENLVSAAREQRPVYVHFPLMAGRDNRLTFDAVAAWLEKTDTRFVNTHLAPRGSDYDIAPGQREPCCVEAMTERLIADVQAMVNRFGAERVIVENAPMPDPPPYDIPVLPVEVMTQVIEATGAGLLLDLAHATLTCENLNLDIHDYLRRMPVKHLRELHVTGVDEGPQGRREDHLPMTAFDWSLLEWAIDEIRAGRWARPQVMAFEYGGVGPMFEWRSDQAVIASQVPRLVKLARSVGENIR